MFFLMPADLGWRNDVLRHIRAVILSSAYEASFSCWEEKTRLSDLGWLVSREVVNSSQDA